MRITSASAPLFALLFAPLALHAQPAVTAWGPPDDDLDWSEAQCLSHLAEVVCRRPNEDGTGYTFTTEASARESARWEGGLNIQPFRVFSLDRDDGGVTPEHVVVANSDGLSTGMGVAYWTLYVLEETPAGPVLRSSATVQEFGPEGQSFAVDDGLVLWATEWLGGPDPTRQRGDGLYFVGRPFRLENGRLVPAADLPLRARRFLDSFAEERGSSPPDPVAWLAHPSTERRPVDPYLAGGETSAFRGAVEAVTAQAAERIQTNWVLHIAPDEGEPVVYTYAFGYAEDIERPFTYVGDAASGRLYPSGYLPSDFEALMTGRRVRVATYAGEYEPRVVVWLE